jgi:hypothetical protein
MFVIKSRRIRWTKLVTRVGETSQTKFWLVKLEEVPPGTPDAVMAQTGTEKKKKT